MIKALIDSSVG